MENLLAIGFAGMAITFLIGASVGSFLNVVVYRLPIMQARRWRDDAFETLTIQATPRAPYNLAWPRSQCPTCRTPIPFYHNVPIVSFFVLRGACRQCRAPIPRRYPIIEVLIGVIALVCVARWGFTVSAASYLVFIAGLAAIALIDWDTGFIPDEISVTFIWLGLVNVAWIDDGDLLLADAIAGAIAGYLVLWAIFWAFKLSTGRDGMGYGDFKLLAAIGAWLGWQMLPTVVLVAAISGLVFASARYLKTRDTGPLPFGPFLSLGGVAALFMTAGWA